MSSITENDPPVAVAPAAFPTSENLWTPAQTGPQNKPLAYPAKGTQQVVRQSPPSSYVILSCAPRARAHGSIYIQLTLGPSNLLYFSKSSRPHTTGCSTEPRSGRPSPAKSRPSLVLLPRMRNSGSPESVSCDICEPQNGTRLLLRSACSTLWLGDENLAFMTPSLPNTSHPRMRLESKSSSASIIKAGHVNT